MTFAGNDVALPLPERALDPLVDGMVVCARCITNKCTQIIKRPDIRLRAYESPGHCGCEQLYLAADVVLNIWQTVHIQLVR